MTADIDSDTTQAANRPSPTGLSDFEALGYRNIRTLPDGRVVGLHPFLFTVGLVVGLTPTGYDHRYCYPDAESAWAAIIHWDGTGHPPGPWIKRKGRGGEFPNPQTFKGIPVREDRQTRKAHV